MSTALEILIGRAGCGKTETIMRRIAAELEEDPWGPPIWLVVPEHVTFVAEARLAALTSGHTLMRAQVVSLPRLAHQLLTELGDDDAVPIREPGKFALVALLCESLRDQFLVLQGQIGRPHVIRRLVAWIDETRRHHITVAMLRGFCAGPAVPSGVSAKFQDLALLLEAYIHHVAGRFTDSEDLYPQLARKMPAAIGVVGATIYFDGFVSFSPQELSVIEAFCRNGDRVAIAIAAPSSFVLSHVRSAAKDGAFLHPFTEAIDMLAELEALCARLDGHGIHWQAVSDETCARFCQAPVLGALEHHLLTVAPNPIPNLNPIPDADRETGAETSVSLPSPDSQLVIAHADSRRAEVLGVLADVLRRRELGDRFRDTMVIVSNLDAYANWLQEEFGAAGVPYYMDRKESIARHPLAVGLLSALATAARPDDAEALFACLKSDLLPIPRLMVDRLENDWLAGRWKMARLSGGLMAGPHSQHSRAETLLRAWFLPLWQTIRDADVSVRTVATALWSFLESTSVHRQVRRMEDRDLQAGRVQDAKLHSRALAAVCSALEDLVSLFGDQSLPLDLIHSVLAQALDGVTAGGIPATTDQVLVIPAARVRFTEAPHVWVLGVVAGEFPVQVAEDDLVPDNERMALAAAGIRLGTTAAQHQLYERYRVYHVLTRATKRLTVCAPSLDDRGRTRSPSPLLDAIRRAVSPTPVLTVTLHDRLTDDDHDRALLISQAHAVSWLAQALAATRQTGTVSSLWRHVYGAFAKGQWHAPLIRQALLGLRHDVVHEVLQPALAEVLYGSDMTSSVSRLEQFAACPFAHFAKYGLRIGERQRSGVDALARGTLAHATLRYFTQDLSDGRWSSSDLPAAEVQIRLDRAFDRALQEPAHRAFSLSARSSYEASQVRTALARTAEILVEHLRRGAFWPVAAEVSFGQEGDVLPAFEVRQRGDRRLRLRGQIDRIDVAADEGTRWFRIIDYKSSIHEFAADLTFYGLSLQLPVYAALVEQEGHRLVGGEAAWAGLFYVPVKDVTVSVQRPAPPQLATVSVRKQLRLKGLMRNDEALVDLFDRLSRHGQTDLWPRLLKNDGSFTAFAKAVSFAEWQALTRHVQQKIGDLVEDMYAGLTSVSPFRYGTKTACDTCSFRSFCRFEPAAGAGRYRPLPRQSTATVFARLTSETGGGDP